MKTYIQHSAPHPGEMLMELYFKPLELSVKNGGQIEYFKIRPAVNRQWKNRDISSHSTAVKLAQALRRLHNIG